MEKMLLLHGNLDHIPILVLIQKFEKGRQVGVKIKKSFNVLDFPRHLSLLSKHTRLPVLI